MDFKLIVHFNDKRLQFRTLMPKQDTFSILKNIMINNLKDRNFKIFDGGDL
jgi:hypothetical protein